MGKNCIYGGLDPSPVHHFLNSNVIVLPKDKKRITTLFKHLDNIETIKRSIDIIGMRSAGFTSVHEEQKKALEQNLKDAIPSCFADLELCLKELSE